MVYRGEIGFVRLLFALISGILLTKVYANETTYSLTGYLVLLLVINSILLLILYRKKDIYINSWVSGLNVHLVFILLGYFLSLHTQYRYSKNYFASKAPEALVLVVRSEPQNTRMLTRFEAEVRSVVKDGKPDASNGMLLVSIPKGRAVRYAYGDELLVPALHRPVEPPHNPAEFDYRKYLANRAVFNQIYLEPGQVRRIRTGSANLLFAEALYLRNRMILLYDRYLDRESAALMSTLLLGYRASLSKERIAAFTNTGTLHVLSVSGMHVGILALILGFLFLPLKESRASWLYPLLIIVAIWFYAILTGLSAPVCRAALMLSCVLIGKTLSRRQNSYNLIAISAFFLLLYNPLYLFDVGFQLSYIAVLGLIYLHPKLYATLYFKHYVADKVWSYIALSIAAQVATLPLSLYYFHQFPVYFLPANLFIALPVMLIMLLGMLMIIPVDIIREALAQSLDAIISFTNSGLAWIEKWPFSTVQSVWLSVTELALSGILIWLLTRFGVQRKARWLYASLFCIVLLVSSFSYRSVNSQNKKQIVFFSLRKSNPMAVINNQKVTVFTNLEKDDPDIRFALTPYLDKTGVNTRKWMRTDQLYETGEMINDGNYFSLGSWKLIRYDRQMRYRNFKRGISVDVLLLTGNPYLDLEEIDKNIMYKLLLIDASNSDRSIDKWSMQAERIGLSHYVLKKNDAYIVDLSY